MYEESSGAVATALKSSSAEVFNRATIDAILALSTGTGDTGVSIDKVISLGGQVTVAAGTEIAMIQTNPLAMTTLSAPANSPVVIFQGAGVNATFDGGLTSSAAGVVDRVIIGSSGADMIILGGSSNNQVTIGDGDTVVGGMGADTVFAGSGESTVQGGTGFTVVQLAGNSENFVVTTNSSGAAVVTGANGATTLEGVQFVQLDDKDALVIARNEAEAAVATLYEAVFGRAADGNGLDYWFDRVNEGASLDAIANAFLASAEYNALTKVSDADFVNNAYASAVGADAKAADMALWISQLANGTADRADVLTSITQMVAADLADNTSIEFIGSVTIITTII